MPLQLEDLRAVLGNKWLYSCPQNLLPPSELSDYLLLVHSMGTQSTQKSLLDTGPLLFNGLHGQPHPAPFNVTFLRASEMMSLRGKQQPSSDWCFQTRCRGLAEKAPQGADEKSSELAAGGTTVGEGSSWGRDVGEGGSWIFQSIWITGHRQSGLAQQSCPLNQAVPVHLGWQTYPT